MLQHYRTLDIISAAISVELSQVQIKLVNHFHFKTQAISICLFLILNYFKQDLTEQVPFSILLKLKIGQTGGTY